MLYLQWNYAHEIPKWVCGIDVDEETIVVLFHLFLLETVFDQVGFTHTTGWHQGNIITVYQKVGKHSRLVHPVAEVLRSDIAICHKRIVNHILLFARKDSIFIVIIKK